MSSPGTVTFQLGCLTTMCADGYARERGRDQCEQPAAEKPGGYGNDRLETAVASLRLMST